MAIGDFLGQIESDQVKIRIDYASATITYYGFAAPGAVTSAASWMIRRETLDSSSRTTQVDWADSDCNPDNVWDNRASLNYG